jgi:hypothetical protein
VQTCCVPATPPHEIDSQHQDSVFRARQIPSHHGILECLYIYCTAVSSHGKRKDDQGKDNMREEGFVLRPAVPWCDRQGQRPCDVPRKWHVFPCPLGLSSGSGSTYIQTANIDVDSLGL